MKLARYRYSQPLIYALPAWPLAMLGIPLYLYLPAYYHALGLDLGVIGLALLAARLTDVVSDPLIGYVQDKMPQKWSYALIISGWFGLLISLYSLFLPQQVSPLQLTLSAFFVYLSWTLIVIPYQAFSAQVSRASHRKTHFTAAREAMTILGMVSVLLLAYGLDELETEPRLFAWLYPIIALSLTLSLIVMLRQLRRPLAALPVQTLPFFQGLKQLWRIHDSRRLLPAYGLNSLANAFPATLFVLFVAHYLRLEAYSGILLLSFFLSGVLALPFWVWLARRIGKFNAWRVSLALACVAFIWVFMLNEGALWGFALICIVSGFSLGADMALPASIQADIAQSASASQGEVSGIAFGLWGVLTKLALALAVGLAFPLLDAMGWAHQTATSLNGLLWLYAGAPIALKLFVLLWLSRPIAPKLSVMH